MTTKMEQAVPAMARNPRGLPGPRLVLLARATIFIERAAPILVVAGAPVALVVIASLFDVWIHAPLWAHALALAGALASCAYFALRMRRPDLWPSRKEALERLERDGGVRHDALKALEDAPAAGAGPLWNAHLDAMREKAKAARLGAARRTADLVDPFGARYAVFALALVGWIAAGGEAGQRLAAGFIPGDPRVGAPGFADLWIEPPAYTGKAPVYLLRAGDALPGAHDDVEVPEGSIVRAQVNARSRFSLTMRTASGASSGERDGAERSMRASLVLSEPGVLTLRAGGRTGRWPVSVVDDSAPTVEFVEPPAADVDGRLAFAVRTGDDYGIASASLRLRLDPDQPRPLDSPAFSDEAMAESRLAPVEGVAGDAGARAASVDLQSDPWAGLRVIVALVVVDAAGQTGETAPVRVTLPAKRFYNALAKAVIEQRQSLAVAPQEWRRAEWAFNGLTLGPEYFFDKPTDYLLLRTAMWRVAKSAGGDLRNTVDEFWPLALQLEDENLELARRRLEAAREALREALEKGASASEIERLTEAMRAALQQYLQALAQAGGQDADGPPPDEIVSSADLDSMLDAIRDLANSGAENAARQALDDLERLLDNLRFSPRSAGGGADGRQGQSAGAVGEAGDLIGRERELADKSFERSQRRGASGGELADEQGAIAGDLSALMDSLEGAASKGEGAAAAGRAFEKALGDMRRAQEALKEDDFDGADAAMERAIANLRDGARSLARDQSADSARARSGSGAQILRDPLGRPAAGAYGRDVKVPEKSDAQRTRELLQELRRRLADGERTEEEIKYLERLLERF